MFISESSQKLLILATTYKETPEEFLFALRDSFLVPHNGSGKFFLETGIILYGYDYFNLAEATWYQALANFVNINDKRGQSDCWGNLSLVKCKIGKLGEAVQCGKVSLLLSKEANYAEGELSANIALGNTYLSLGNYAKARDHCETAVKIIEGMSSKNEKDYSLCLRNLGVAYENLKEFEKAKKCYSEALQIAKSTDDSLEQLAIYSNLGVLYSRVQDYDTALHYQKIALNIVEYEIRDKSQKVIVYLNLGFTYMRRKDFFEAEKYLQTAQMLAEELSNMELRRLVSLNLGCIYYDPDNPLSNFLMALARCMHSIELSRTMAKTLASDSNKTVFEGKIFDAYQLMVLICLRFQEDIEDKLNIDAKKYAFEFVQESKSRSLLDSLIATNNNAYSKIENNVSHESPVASMKTRSSSPYIFEYDPRTSSLHFKETQKMISSFNKKTILVEYFIAHNQIIMFSILSDDEEIYVSSKPVNVNKMTRDVEQYWNEVVSYPEFGDIGAGWLDMGNYLIEPISDLISGKDLIYFAPFGVLHNLPLHSLELNGKPLTHKHAVAYCPTASVLKHCLSKGTGKLKSGVSFGVDFEDEARTVAGLFEKELFKKNAYFAKEVTKERVRANLQKDIIHFSCHGHHGEYDPLSSGLKLHDGVLTINDILSMPIKTELVTLSACETGFNWNAVSEEPFGLTRAFLYAGAPSVVVSLWPVDAKCTEKLMVEFYKRLKNGEDKATALQKAQEMIRRQKQYSHPYYWAPFELIGKF